MRETITDLRKRLALEPHDEALTCKLAALYERNEQRGEALRLLKDLLRTHPDASTARETLLELNLTSWPTYRGSPRREGRSSALALRNLPVVRWSWESRHEGQALVYPPVVQGIRALVVTAPYDKVGGFDPVTARLVCIDLRNGAQLWSQSRTCMPGMPVFDGDDVLWGWLTRSETGDIHPELMRFNPYGEMLWYSNPPPIFSQNPYDPSPLLLHEGTLYFASNGFRPGLAAEGGYFTAIDAQTGVVHEHVPLTGPRTPVVGHNGIYFYNDDGLVYRFTPERELVQVAELVSPYQNMSSPVAVGDHIFMMIEGQSGARLMRFGDEAYADVIWRFGSEGTFAHSPCLGERSELYLATGRRRIVNEQIVVDGHLAAVDSASGEVLSSRTEPWRSTGSPTLAEGVLYICGEFSQASRLNAELPPDLLGDVVLPEEMQAHGEGYLYPEGVRRCLSAFDTQRGFEPLWRMPMLDHHSASIAPIPVADMLLVPYGPGRLVALAATR